MQKICREAKEKLRTHKVLDWNVKRETLAEGQEERKTQTQDEVGQVEAKEDM